MSDFQEGTLVVCLHRWDGRGLRLPTIPFRDMNMRIIFTLLLFVFPLCAAPAPYPKTDGIKPYHITGVYATGLGDTASGTMVLSSDGSYSFHYPSGSAYVGEWKLSGDRVLIVEYKVGVVGHSPFHWSFPLNRKNGLIVSDWSGMQIRQLPKP